ncbi:OsmC family protein [Pseudochrobactrum sp. MP213Fo]|uniref:OsmC family protein n=1 Tax=Pseudochrobactrum sp. MP213Fo TaxID=3022250 RepID=UPI003BA144FE
MNRTATAIWNGDLKTGTGKLSTQSTALADLPYSFKSRTEDVQGQTGTNPEELIGAAHAGCFTMRLSSLLSTNGTPPQELQTTATISTKPNEGGGFSIAKSELVLRARVANISETDFQKLAKQAKENCPVSRALNALEITLKATLL